MIEWGVSLKDGVSQPADAAASAMGRAADAANKMHEHVSGLAGAWEVFEGSLAARVVERAFDAIVDSGRELISMAIEASERVSHLTEVFGALSGASEESAGAAGKAIFDLTRTIAKQLPQSEATIQSWARSLMAAGVTDMTKLQDSLKAISGAEALVTGGGERLRSVLEKLNEASEKGTKIRFNVAQLAGTGVTESEFLKQIGMTAANFEAAKKHGQITGTAIAEALTRAIGEKAAGPLAGQMGELATVMQKGKDLFTQLFEGTDAKPLVDMVRELVGLFDQAQPSGQLLHSIVVSIFDAVMRGAKVAEDAFLHLIIYTLEAAIWVKQLGKTWRTTWDDMLAAADRLSPVLAGIAATIFTLFVPSIYAAVAGAVMWALTAIPAAITATIAWAASMWAAAVAVIAATWPLLLIAVAVGLVVAGIVLLVRHWAQVKQFFSDMAAGAVHAGKSFVEGLANGIRAGADFVINAVKNLGGIVIKAIRAILGVHSPSTIMFGVGLNVAEGLEGGIDQGAPKAAEASERMGAGVAGAASPGSGSGGSSSSNVFNIDVHIEAGHAATPQQLQHIVEEEFGSLANRLAAMIGSAPVPA
ncbi:MAG: hypothetical protein WBY94_22115 [Polyangiaceae bacterium]